MIGFLFRSLGWVSGAKHGAVAVWQILVAALGLFGVGFAAAKTNWDKLLDKIFGED